MSSTLISYHEDFLELCDHIRSAGLVAFDTEFVSDNSYRPELGLLQFATADRCVAVDPLEIEDLSSWWEIMADPDTRVVVHGGQAEIRFCLNLCGRAPANLYDIQLAEGFRGRSYPLSYSAIVQRVLSRSIDSSQTRTDWTRRPLSEPQLRYALEDVEHVLEIYERQTEWLKQNQRLSWMEAETERLIHEIVKDDALPPWDRLSGLHKLNRKELAIVHSLAEWREQEAEFHNRPVRRVLRDDLLIDLAKRKPKTPQQALATRDMNRSEYRRRLDDILNVIAEALNTPDSQLPQRPRSRRNESTSDEQVISKLLSLSLANRCAELDLAQSLVGNNKDLTELVRYHRFHDKSNGVPRLLEGWRRDVCGDLLTDVMDGRVSFRVAGRNAATPLEFSYQSAESSEGVTSPGASSTD